MLSTVPLLPHHLISICWNIPKREITSYFRTQTRKVVLLQLSGILPLHTTSTSSSSQLDLATSTWGGPSQDTRRYAPCLRLRFRWASRDLELSGSMDELSGVSSHVWLREGKCWDSLLDKKTARLCFSRLLDFFLWHVFFPKSPSKQSLTMQKASSIPAMQLKAYIIYLLWLSDGLPVFHPPVEEHIH